MFESIQSRMVLWSLLPITDGLAKSSEDEMFVFTCPGSLEARVRCSPSSFQKTCGEARNKRHNGDAIRLVLHGHTL